VLKDAEHDRRDYDSAVSVRRHNGFIAHHSSTGMWQDRSLSHSQTVKTANWPADAAIWPTDAAMTPS
jgi:hypothetical protein